MVNPLKRFQSKWAKLIKFGHEYRDMLTIMGVLVLVAVGIVIVWKVPKQQVKAYGTITNSNEKRAMLEDAFRKTLSQIVLSVFGILLIYFTWRRTRAAESTLTLTQQSDITDRYTKAIEQLGKMDGNRPNLEVRLGAVYALGRVASDSIPDHWPIMEVLTAYVRHNAPLNSEPYTRKEKPRVDIQAVLTVIGGRETGPGREDRANKDRGNEDRANQQYLDLMKCRLCGAKLNGANFRGADLEKADLRGAFLWGAKLQGAALMEANLTETRLQEAELNGAYFRDTILTDADLERADIREAVDLTDQQIKSARNGAQHVVR